MDIYVLSNPPRVGVGLPLGAYSSFELAVEAAATAGLDAPGDERANCRVHRLVLDAPADYAAAETVWAKGGQG